MGQRTVGQRRSRSLQRWSISTEDATASARADALRIGRDDAAPRQTITLDDHRERVGDAVLGALHDDRRQVLVAQACCVFGKANRLVCHG
jgi:hypothetical protein